MAAEKEHARQELERLYTVAKSAVVVVNSNIGLKIWLRKAAMVLKEAVVYDREGQLARAYVLYLRYIWIVVELRKHREYNAAAYQAELAAHKKKADACMTRCEALKEKLLETLAQAPVLPPPSATPAAGPGPAPIRRDSILYGGLRSLTVPSELVPTFLRVAEPNTRRSIETCAVLCGTLEHDRLRVTHVVVPKQRGTADTCATYAEEELFHYLDVHGLLCLGWIHTHPTQSCFMSSVDLHTHASYQLMLPEAIAIVCAPRFNTHAAFQLTRPYGLDYIVACPGSGFHKHPDQPPLYQMCEANVQYTAGFGVVMHDLR